MSFASTFAAGAERCSNLFTTELYGGRQDVEAPQRPRCTVYGFRIGECYAQNKAGEVVEKGKSEYDVEVNKDLIKDLRERIQFLVMAEIFCSTVVFQFFKMMGTEDALSYKNASMWVLGAAFVILNYVLAERVNNSKYFRWISRQVYLTLAFIVFFIVVTVLVQFKPLPSYYTYLFKISFWGTIFLPVITTFTILGDRVVAWSKVNEAQLH